MKLSNLILEESSLLEENLLNTLKKAISKVGQFLKNTLKKVLEKLPFGKRTTIRVPVDYSILNEVGAFGNYAGQYVEHATAYYLCLAMKEAGLNVITDVGTLEANMNKAYDEMVDSAGGSGQQNQIPQKVDAGKVLGTKILDEVTDLPDLELTQFKVDQVGTGGAKADIAITIIKPDLTRVLGVSLKATDNTTDINGANWILRVAARFFYPQILNAKGHFKASDNDKVMQALPEFGKLQQKFFDNWFTATEYKNWEKEADRIREEATKKFNGSWQSEKGETEEETQLRREKLIKHYTDLGFVKIHKGKPSVVGFHFLIKEKFGNSEEKFDSEWKKITNEFSSLLTSTFEKEKQSGINWAKNQLGITTDQAFYAYLSQKVTGGKAKVITSKHSPEFIDAVNKLVKGKLTLKIEKKSSKEGEEKQGASLYIGDVHLMNVTYTFGRFGVFSQAKLKPSVATDI